MKQQRTRSAGKPKCIIEKKDDTSWDCVFVLSKPISIAEAIKYQSKWFGLINAELDRNDCLLDGTQAISNFDPMREVQDEISEICVYITHPHLSIIPIKVAKKFWQLASG